jgi:peroxiredoxin
MKISRSLLAAVALLAAAAASVPAQTRLKVGDMAPDFTLPSTTGKPIHLADYRGKKNVVLAFYVLAFTGG